MSLLVLQRHEGSKANLCTAITDQQRHKLTARRLRARGHAGYLPRLGRHEVCRCFSAWADRPRKYGDGPAAALIRHCMTISRTTGWPSTAGILQCRARSEVWPLRVFRGLVVAWQTHRLLVLLEPRKNRSVRSANVFWYCGRHPSSSWTRNDDLMFNLISNQTNKIWWRLPIHKYNESTRQWATVIYKEEHFILQTAMMSLQPVFFTVALMYAVD